MNITRGKQETPQRVLIYGTEGIGKSTLASQFPEPLFIDTELDWDDTIENDGEEFIVLPAGDYDFEVIDFERARHGGSEKLPPCNKAVLHIKVKSADGKSTTIKHNLFLHSKCEGMLCTFFTGIGQRQHGQKVIMNWNAVIGSVGRCKVGIRNWKSKDGEDMQSNEIKKFYEPVDGQQTGTQWKAGNF